MPRGKAEQAEVIIPKLREVEVELGRGKTVAEAVKKIGVTEQTYYRWKKKYGGLRMDQAKRLKELEKENSRLKCLLADAELDKAILREVAEGKFLAVTELDEDWEIEVDRQGEKKSFTIKATVP
jgi:transposase